MEEMTTGEERQATSKHFLSRNFRSMERLFWNFKGQQ